MCDWGGPAPELGSPKQGRRRWREAGRGRHPSRSESVRVSDVGVGQRAHGGGWSESPSPSRVLPQRRRRGIPAGDSRVECRGAVMRPPLRPGAAQGASLASLRRSRLSQVPAREGRSERHCRARGGLVPTRRESAYSQIAHARFLRPCIEASRSCRACPRASFHVSLHGQPVTRWCRQGALPAHLPGAPPAPACRSSPPPASPAIDRASSRRLGPGSGDAARGGIDAGDAAA